MLTKRILLSALAGTLVVVGWAALAAHAEPAPRSAISRPRLAQETVPAPPTDTPTATQSPTSTATASPTATPTRAPLSWTIAGGPDPFCPGWRLHYDLRITNTVGITLTQFEVRAPLPPQTYNPSDGGSTVPGVFDPVAKEMVWDLGSVGAGDRARAYLIVNSYTTVSVGTTLVAEFAVVAPELPEAVIASAGLVADPRSCEATRTATPSATHKPEPTATPTATQAGRHSQFCPQVLNRGRF